MKTTISMAKNIFRKAAEKQISDAKAGVTPFHANISMLSAPGVGKSSIVAQVAEELGVPMQDIRLVSMEAADVQGIPYVKGEDMDFSTPSWFPTPEDPKLSEDDPRKSPYGILFFDELPNAPRQVQQAAYRIILDREINNGRRLPDGWVIVAAGNRKEDKTGSADMPPALANRFASHIHLRVDKDDFLSYAAYKGIHHHVQGYIAFQPEMLFKFDPHKNMEEAFPTPRSWEFVSNHLSLGYDEDELPLVIAGCIGEGAASQFLGFRKYYSQLPNFEKIMEGEEYKVPLDKDPGVIFALCSSLLSYVMETIEQENYEGLENLGKVVLQLPDEFKSLFFKQYKQTFTSAKDAGRIPKDKSLTAVFRHSSSMNDAFMEIDKFLKHH